MEPKELVRDIGRIVQVESRSSRMIGYLSRLQADRIYLSDWDPRIEAQKGLFARKSNPLTRINIKDISTVEYISPIELSLETIGSLRIGTPLQFRYDDSAGVGYVASITPKKLKITQYEPIIEAQKGWVDRKLYPNNFSLDALLPGYNAASKMGLFRAAKK